MICLLSADLVDDQEVKEEIEKITIEAKNNLEKFKRDNDVRRRSSHNVRRYKELTILRMFTSHIPPASSLYIVNWVVVICTTVIDALMLTNYCSPPSTYSKRPS